MAKRIKSDAGFGRVNAGEAEQRRKNQKKVVELLITDIKGRRMEKNYEGSSKKAMQTDETEMKEQKLISLKFKGQIIKEQNQ